MQNSGLTIAERTRKAEQDKLDAQARQQSQSSTSSAPSSAWLGLDSLGASSQSHSSSSHGEDDWFTATPTSGPAAAVKTSPYPAQQLEDDDWGLSDFGTPAASTETASKHASRRPYDEPMSRSRPDSPGRDFDFGEREDILSHQANDDGDDILGELGKPQVTSLLCRRNPLTHVHSKPKQMPSRPVASSSPAPSPRPPSSRAASPPPHILGQIVEMGFSPQQARVALAATESGLDVQAAIENLISNGAGSGSSRPISRQEASPPPPRRQPQRPAHRERQDSDSRSGPSPQDGSIQDQAEKVLSQASEIGMNMFGKASAFWAAGKDRVQKAYEERAAATAATDSRASSSASGARSTRPRWMTEESVEDEPQGPSRNNSTFRDQNVAPDPPAATSRSPLTKAQSSPPPSKPQPAVDLFSDDTPKGPYVSKFRHGRPKPTAAAAAPPSSFTAASAPAEPPRPPRPKVSASREALSTSQRHKAAGTEKFKLGQYADAVSAYSLAISALPSKHLVLIALHNNRALAQIKTGEHSAAARDATAVIDIIGPDFVPGPSAKISGTELEGGDVDLADSLLKAWKRRAEAFEGTEKWEDARKDWERVAGAGWASAKVRSEGVNGAGRCRKMTSSASSLGQEQVKPKPKPKPTRPPPRRGPTPPSVALNSFRKANEAQAAEEDLRYELKDSVDARLNSWKGGKEANIRALISSLDTVLWPELGWESVGMKDLITEKQVKIRYNKAIGRLHPDKVSISPYEHSVYSCCILQLNATNTKLEHRMIANGVFGALNDAWNAFQQQ